MNPLLVRVPVFCLFALVCLQPLCAAPPPGSTQTPAATAGKMLPQKHDYQRQLRAWMATLTEKDFEHGVTANFEVAPIGDDQARFRLWLLSFTMNPLFGTKRGPPSVNVRPRRFLLPDIETPEAVMKPHVWPEPLAWLIQWNYPGNPYYGSRALKLRAFVTMCIEMLMVDDFQETTPDGGANRADFFAPHLILFANPYPVVKDVLPREVQQAYETGLRKMGRRVLDWGAKGDESNLDMLATVGLWYTSQALNDPEFAREVEAYGRRLFAYERLVRPAGFYAIWAAVATDWPFARESVERTCRLRTHLCLPEPDGQFLGPSYYGARAASDGFLDSWPRGAYLDQASVMLTDEALFRIRMPDPDEFKAVVDRRIHICRYQLKENPLVYEKPTVPPTPRQNWNSMKNEEILSYPWTWRMWQSFNFPDTINCAYENYRPGTHARLVKLQQENSPVLKSPFLRDETFIRTFENRFTVARMPGYAAILHTAPIGKQQTELPNGFGGGQLSAFWTPATGCVLLGQRHGRSDDKLDEWRVWPMNSVIGVTTDGKFFTSARVQKPEVVSEIKKDSAQVRVTGTLLPMAIEYARALQVEKDSVRVDLGLKLIGGNKVSELHEVLPVFLRETNLQKKAQPTVIEFQALGKWTSATTEYQDRVTAVRLTRFEGSVLINFDRARRAKLAPSDWTDVSASRAACRNVLVDLLDGKGKASPLKQVAFKYEVVAPHPSR